MSNIRDPVHTTIVERFHGTVKRRLDKLCDEGIPYSAALQQVMFDIRCTPNETIGQAPFTLFFNRWMPTKWNLVSEDVVSTNPKSLSEQYEKNQKRARFLDFKEGEKVVVKRGSHSKFSVPAVIVMRKEHGL